MQRNIIAFFLTFLAIFVLLNSSNNAFALYITTYGGNLKQQDLTFINDLIDGVDSSLPDIESSSWPTQETLYGDDTEFKEYTFDVTNVEYIFIKYGNLTDLYYVGNENVLNWTSSTGNALSNSAVPAPVPEPSTLILIGTGLAGIVGLGKKRFLKK